MKYWTRYFRFALSLSKFLQQYFKQAGQIWETQSLNEIKTTPDIRGVPNCVNLFNQSSTVHPAEVSYQFWDTLKMDFRSKYRKN